MECPSFLLGVSPAIDCRGNTSKDKDGAEPEAEHGCLHDRGASKDATSRLERWSGNETLTNAILQSAFIDVYIGKKFSILPALFLADNHPVIHFVCDQFIL